MTTSHPVFLFPGQGGYSSGLLARAQQLDGVEDIIETVRAVADAEADVSLDACMADGEQDLEELLRIAPDALQFAIYAASLAASQALRKAGVTPSVHVGHSFGEISALAAAGACSVADGARIIAYRIRALSRVRDRGGYMVSAAVERPRAEGLLAFVAASDATVAGRNEEQQTVFSGAAPALDSLVSALRAVGVPTTRLPSPYPFHSPVLQPAVAPFAEALGAIRWSQPSTPVYSPILGRAYRPGDDLPDILAAHLTTPFDFLSAVRSQFADGARLFVECGGRSVLTNVVRRVLAEETGWLAVATDSSSSAAAPVEQIVQLTTGDDSALRRAVRDVLNPVPSREEFDRFWMSEGFTVREAVRRSYERFRLTAPGTRPAASAPADGDVDGDVAVEAAPAAEPAPVGEPSRDLDRSQVLAETIELYAEALEYPAEVFTEDIELEAELGVDSVKQTALLLQVARKYGLPPAPEDLRITDFQTLGHVVDLVMDSTAADRAG